MIGEEQFQTLAKTAFVLNQALMLHSGGGVSRWKGLLKKHFQ